MSECLQVFALAGRSVCAVVGRSILAGFKLDCRHVFTLAALSDFTVAAYRIVGTGENLALRTEELLLLATGVGILRACANVRLPPCSDCLSSDCLSAPASVLSVSSWIICDSRNMGKLRREKAPTVPLQNSAMCDLDQNCGTDGVLRTMNKQLSSATVQVMILEFHQVASLVMEFLTAASRRTMLAMTALSAELADDHNVSQSCTYTKPIAKTAARLTLLTRVR